MNQNAFNRPAFYKLFCCLLATFFISLSMGMNAVIFPVSMEKLQFSESSMGLVLAGETLAALMVCMLLNRLLRHYALIVLLLLAVALRMFALWSLLHSQHLWQWLSLVFSHGVGAYLMVILLQVLISTLRFNQHQTLVNAIFGVMVSMGYMVGPLIFESVTTSVSMQALVSDLEFTGTQVALCLSLVVSFLCIPFLFFLPDHLKYENKAQSVNAFYTVKESPGVFGAVANAGVINFGICAFITIYGIRNGMSVYDSATLLAAFMAGCILLEPVYAWLSSLMDLRYFLFANIFVSLAFSAFLPLVIYHYLQSIVLLFLWGGSTASVYSVAMSVLSKRFDAENMVRANAAFSLMDTAGGTIGVILIGLAIDHLGTEGMPYILMAASILYFSYALTRYRIE